MVAIFFVAVLGGIFAGMALADWVMMRRGRR